jgi:hypothetical protein
MLKKLLLSLTLCLAAGTAGAQQTSQNLTIGGEPVTFGTSSVVLISPNGVTQPPTFSPSPGTYSSAQTVALASTTSGAVIYYTTDGSTPSTSSAVYSTPLTVSFTQTINAIAQASGETQSTVSSGVYTITAGAAATPTFSPSAGTYMGTQTVSLAAATSGSTIYYTTDGSTPTTSSAVYSSALTISSTTTVKAIAAAVGYSNSATGSATYTIVSAQAATPTFSPGSGTYGSAQSVTMACATGSSTIYYTTNGTTPTTSSSVYSSAISVATTTTVQALCTASGYTNSNIGSAAYTIGGTGETPVFSCLSSGFASSGSCSGVFGYSGQHQIQGTALYLAYTTSGHAASNWWSPSQANISSGFDATFTFYQNGNMTGAGGTFGAVASPSNPAIAAMSFIFQNNNASSIPNSCTATGFNIYGQNSSADANMAAFGAYGSGGDGSSGQCPIGNAIGIKFDWGGVNGSSTVRTYPTSSSAMAQTGLYYNWGPWDALVPTQDMAGSYGLNLYSQDLFKVHVWYDNSAGLLTMTLLDTTTNQQYRASWPINITTVIGSNSGWFGFGVGAGPSVIPNILITGINFSTGLYTRLATPTLSLASGAYSGTQTETITGPSGSTCYYTTNGLQPTTSSTTYSGSFSVSSSEVVQAVCVEGGYTDSYVAQGNYLIQSSGAYPINIATFTANNMQYNGSAVVTGGYAKLTDTGSAGNQSGTVFYPYPVATGTFTAHFTIKNVPGGGANGGYADCSSFILEGSPSPTRVNNGYVSAGPNMVGYGSQGCGALGDGTPYPITPAVVVNFDEYTGQIGVYQNGSGSAVSVTGISLTNTTPVAYTLVSNGSTIALSATQSGVGSFSHTYTVNVPSVVSSSAYVGFGAGNGGGQAEHDVTEFDYTSP